MATANTSIVSSLYTAITTPLTDLSSFLKTHETFLIVLLLVVGGIYGAQKYFDYQSLMADKKVAADAQTLQTQLAAQQSATLATQQAANQAQQSQAAYTQLIQSVTAQNAALVAAVNQRNTQTATQQQTDSTLPDPALAARMATLANVTPSTITTGPTTMSLTYPTAVAVTQQLELIPSLQADVSSFQTESKNKDTELSSCNNAVAALNTQVSAQNIQIADDKTVLAATQKQDAAELKAVKKTALKSKLKWFGAGYVAGFISGLFIH